MTVHQKPRRDWTKPAMIAVLVITVFGILGVVVNDYVSTPVVYYDEDEHGQQVCREVETSKGILPCSAFSGDELASFEWRPALTSR